MWIQVRTIDGKKLVRIDGLSKLTKIENLRENIAAEFEVSPHSQRLFFRGKELVNGHTLYDYDVCQNNLIQLMVRAVLQPVLPKSTEDEDKNLSDDKENIAPAPSNNSKETELDGYEATYKVGDLIDARDPAMGAWFEGKIVSLKRKEELTANGKEECELETQTMMEVVDSSSKSECDNLNSSVADESDNKLSEQKIIDENQNKCDKENDPEIANLQNTDVGTDSGKGDITFALSTKENSDKSENTSIQDQSALKEKALDDGFMYGVNYEGYEEDEISEISLKDIRPRAKDVIKFSDIKIGDKVMVNYNYDEPEDRGYWYDADITEKRNTRTSKELHGTIFLGPDLMPLEKCKIIFIDEVMKTEEVGATVINIKDVESGLLMSPTKRKNKPECDHCLDNPHKKCKFCGCQMCTGKQDPDKTILCDECDQAYHIFCLSPPLAEIPEDDEWYCPLCKNDENEVVKAGEKLKANKKKAKMASATSTSNRDWGKGMACVGRTKMCSIVPPNHFGPIPGIEVGTQWKFRVQVSEAGVHRPHVAGIHGREDEGSYSIVLSGGYEDDHDDGDEFTYTGSGGRDLSGNKRTAEQSCDQQLTRMNKALAKVCNASINNKDGSEATDWRAGKPVRVVRNCKGKKHSKFAPSDGNRYDGIYKVVKYWPAKGKSGFIVWRYMLRRDDQSPAPWTKQGQKRIEELGLTLQYPEGYLEAQKDKEEQAEKDGKKKGKGKRSKKQTDDDSTEEGCISPPPKKLKVAAYEVSDSLKKLMEEDVQNKKLWDDCLEHVVDGSQKFLAYVEEIFACICCQDIVFKPVTTSCNHNICKQCLQRSFKAEVFNCPCCRAELGKDYSTASNKTLVVILNKLFPGYENGR